MRLVSRIFIAACLAMVSLSACGSKNVGVGPGCKGLSIAYDPSLSFLYIGVYSTQLHIAAVDNINSDIRDPSSVLSPVALIALPPIPYHAFVSLYNDEQITQDLSFNQKGRDFLIGEVGAKTEPLFRTGSAVAGIMEKTGKNVSIDLWFDASAVNSSNFIRDKNFQVTVYLVAAEGKMDDFTCKSIAKVVLSQDNLKVIDE